MARIAVIGEGVRAQGFGLAGALVVAAEDAAAMRSAWRSLSADIGVVILTAAAADALGDSRHEGGRLTAVLPP